MALPWWRALSINGAEALKASCELSWSEAKSTTEDRWKYIADVSGNPHHLWGAIVLHQQKQPPLLPPTDLLNALPDGDLVEAHTADVLAAAVPLLRGHHAVAGQVRLVAHQHHGHLQDALL